MPEVDAEQALNRTLRTWERHFWMFFDDSTAQRMPRSEEVVDEAIRRSAERIAPCHADKRGATRDALIWLDLVSNGGIGGFAPGVVFISTNKKDFAGADGVSLHPRLQEDIAEHNAVLEYHSSLESFLTEHAEPVGYVTREWVEQQVDFAEVAGQVESWLYSGMSVSAFRAANDPSRAYFEPIGPPVSIASMTPMLTNFYVWRYVDGRLELHVGFDVRVEATMPCQLLTLPPTAMEGAPRDSTPGERLLECVAVLWCDLSAEVEDQEIGALTLDDVYPD